MKSARFLSSWACGLCTNQRLTKFCNRLPEAPAARSTHLQHPLTLGLMIQPARSDWFGVNHHFRFKIDFVLPSRVSYLHLVGYRINHFALSIYPSSCQLVVPDNLEISCPLWFWVISSLFCHRSLIFPLPSQMESISGHCPLRKVCVLASSGLDISGNVRKTQSRALAVDRTNGKSRKKIAPLENLPPSFLLFRETRKRSSWIEVFIFFLWTVSHNGILNNI